MYVSRSGEMSPRPPEEMIKVPDGVEGLNEFYLAELFVLDGPDLTEFRKVGQEIFSKYPTKNQIIWALSKHKAQVCSIRKVYEFNYEY